MKFQKCKASHHRLIDQSFDRYELMYCQRQQSVTTVPQNESSETFCSEKNQKVNKNEQKMVKTFVMSNKRKSPPHLQERDESFVETKSRRSIPISPLWTCLIIILLENLFSNSVSAMTTTFLHTPPTQIPQAENQQQQLLADVLSPYEQWEGGSKPGDSAFCGQRFDPWFVPKVHGRKGGGSSDYASYTQYDELLKEELHHEEGNRGHDQSSDTINTQVEDNPNWQTYPWIAAIEYNVHKNSTIKKFHTSQHSNNPTLVAPPPASCQTAAFIATSILIVPAHCITHFIRLQQHSTGGLLQNETSDSDSGFELSIVRLRDGHRAPIVRHSVHPSYNASEISGQYDIALIQVSFNDDTDSQKSNIGAEYEETIIREPLMEGYPACLPRSGDDFNTPCQTVIWDSKQFVMHDKRDVVFEPSMKCLESPFLSGGYLSDSESILCSPSSRCGLENDVDDGASVHTSPLNKGISFCTFEGRSYLVGIPSDKLSWCYGGSYTRVARYAHWIRVTARQMLLNPPTPHPIKTFSVDEKSVIEEKRVVEGEDICDRIEPCGTNSMCWNLSPVSYACTCNSSFPYGNPYQQCVQCITDEQCENSEDGQNIDAEGITRKTCIENMCVQMDSHHESMLEKDNREKLSPSEMNVGNQFQNDGVGDENYIYEIIEKGMSWPQAQYTCLNRLGSLVELPSISKDSRTHEASGHELFQSTENLFKFIRETWMEHNERGSSFWIGASDFDEAGEFRWFNNGSILSKDLFFEQQHRFSSYENPLLMDQRNEEIYDMNVDSSQLQHSEGVENDDTSMLTRTPIQQCVQLETHPSTDAIRFSTKDCNIQNTFICKLPKQDENVGLGQGDETESVPFVSRSRGSVVVNQFLDGKREREERKRFSSHGLNSQILEPKAPAASVCGRRFYRSRQARIVGGAVSDYGEWPWQVSLRQYKNGQFRHKCGSALLSRWWVITAAHCVKDIAPSNLIVRIGEYNVLDTSEVHKHVNRRIVRVVTHANFNKQSYEYDIAVLKLSSPVDFAPNIIPICLPGDTKDDLVGKVGTVTGWGRRTEYGHISPVLREVQLPILSNSKCMTMYRRSGQNEWIPRIFVCAGTSEGGRDSCEGDSGGPLVIKSDNSKYTLAGVISWGIGCGDRNRPGVYTRISEFKNWIIRNTNYY